MTSPADWKWRADFLRQQAMFLEMQAEETLKEAARYRDLAKKSDFLTRQDPTEPEKGR